MNAQLRDLERRLSRPLRTGADARRHELPWRGPAGTALAVALPVDEEEVRAIVGWGREHRVHLLAQGAVTGLVGASTPPPGGPPTLVVSTDLLTDPLEVRAEDAVAVAGAGVRLSALNDRAAAHGLELPVDLAADPALGAMVATNTGGSRVLRHGDMSAHVLGARAVLADAEVSVVGDLRGLRKDNTGPDPHALLVGSAGAFGIIVAVAVALSPVPAQRRTALVGPLPDTAAVALLATLRRELGDGLSAFEVMCPAALRAGCSRVEGVPVDPGADPSVTALVEASGGDGVAEALVAAVDAAGLAGVAHEVPADVAWAVRHGITEGLAEHGEVIGFDLCVRPARLPALRAAVRGLVAGHRPDLVVADFGHWGDGGVHCNVVVPAGRPLGAEGVARLRASVSALVTGRFDGSWSAEHGVGPLNAGTWAATTDEVTRRALAAHRSVVDPLGVLGHPGLPF